MIKLKIKIKWLELRKDWLISLIPLGNFCLVDPPWWQWVFAAHAGRSWKPIHGCYGFSLHHGRLSDHHEHVPWHALKIETVPRIFIVSSKNAVALGGPFWFSELRPKQENLQETWYLDGAYFGRSRWDICMCNTQLYFQIRGQAAPKCF